MNGSIGAGGHFVDRFASTPLRPRARRRSIEIPARSAASVRRLQLLETSRGVHTRFHVLLQSYSMVQTAPRGDAHYGLHRNYLLAKAPNQPIQYRLTSNSQLLSAGGGVAKTSNWRLELEANLFEVATYRHVPGRDVLAGRRTKHAGANGKPRQLATPSSAGTSSSSSDPQTPAAQPPAPAPAPAPSVWSVGGIDFSGLVDGYYGTRTSTTGSQNQLYNFNTEPNPVQPEHGEDLPGARSRSGGLPSGLLFGHAFEIINGSDVRRRRTSRAGLRQPEAETSEGPAKSTSASSSPAPAPR